MSAPGGQPAGPPAGTAGSEEQLTPEQEQMLRQMEEEMRNLRIEDLVVQSVVSILNLAARRIVKEDERDLAQARIGIDAVAALVDLLDADAQREIMNALSQIRILYAQHAGEGNAAPAADAPVGGSAPGSGSAGETGGPRKPPPGLWVPGSG